MKATHILIAFLLFFITSCTHRTGSKHLQSVNPVIGDISYVKTFGMSPDRTIDEQTRIRTHLAYVERLLRQADVSRLSLSLQNKRANLLDLLHTYWTTGIFPVNEAYPNERRPCFIDNDGRICAVGYLVEQTAGRGFANKINSLFQYATIFEMDLPELAAWVANSGLTLTEVAMIQPAYNPAPTPNTMDHIDPNYGISTAILSGFNFSISLLNVKQVGKYPSSKTLPVIGIISGAGQIALGAFKFPKNTFDPNTGNNITNEKEKAVSFFNIGLGTTTMLLSTYNLMSNRPVTERSTAFNLYTYPASRNQMGLGCSLTKRF